jgi:hypothetical protein
VGGYPDQRSQQFVSLDGNSAGRTTQHVLPSWLMGQTDPAELNELLNVMGWDLRVLAEAQVRSLTAMQRCIDDYRKTADLKALSEIRRHIAELDSRSHQAQGSYATLRDTVRQLEILHTPDR